MVNEQENGLKGQHNLAQGKRSVTLGWRADRKIVRAVKFLKEKILFRTRGMSFCFREMMLSNSVRNNGVALISIFARTVFLLHSLPRAAFRFVPPSTLPRATPILPLQGEEKCVQRVAFLREGGPRVLGVG